MTLLSRDAERTQLDDALTACGRGGTGIVLVEGAVGCGKSALLRYCADAAHRHGVTTVRAAYPDCPTDLTTALGDVPERAPVVVCLDDVHHADAASLGRLTAWVRTTSHTARDGGLLLVLAATDAPHHDAGLATELLKHPACTRIRVGPLDRTATAALVRRHTGGPAAPAVTDGLYLAGGGNPLLLRALLAEPGHVPEPGGPFSRAVLTCLQRCGATAPHLARALAALGDGATTERVASVLRTTPTETDRVLTALRAAGLVLGHRLRHAAAAAAVLDDMGPGEREALHRRVARVLHESRAEAAVIADSLRACGGIDGSQGSGGCDDLDGSDRGWVVPVLREAAQQAMAVDEPERAAACLQLAHASCATDTDERTRSEIMLQLAAITWRLSPAAAEQHLEAPLAALRAGQLGTATAGHLARLLVAQGRIEEGAEALRRATGTDATSSATTGGGGPDRATTGGDGPDRAAGAGATGRAAEADVLRELFALPPGGSSPAPPGGEHLNACAALWTHPGHQDDAQDAGRFLDGAPATQGTHEALAQAVRTLIHADQPRRAADWCRRLQEQIARHRAPGLRAMYGTLHGEALLRLGDLAGAEREATAAIRAVTGRGGHFRSAPVAVLVTALTDMGRYDEAARHLEPLIPERTLATVHALPLLRARGQYFLATRRTEAALGEFLDLGRLARRWGLDRPRQHPWRTDAAEALLRLGRHQEAAELIAEHLALPDATGPRLRGVALRLRAATETPRERTRLLTRAVAELRGSGDRLELARALADLGRGFQTLGEGTRAGSVVRRAWGLAADCGAAPLCEEILPGQDPGAPGSARGTGGVVGAEKADRLSESERKVAALASAGYTNREIAAELFISTSTVEQHLTRIYRKLHITRRRDLPLDLEFDPCESAPLRS
ncbi:MULTISPECIES: LuxR C-terminal-related transcriptional regulator [unclassified Streptomyces]|uniref:LuxR C-terminal-related transcriptional regulator n=1 Tax=unclassified Streptomyces TaxID=2593676 RepID=UPI0035D7A4DA